MKVPFFVIILLLCSLFPLIPAFAVHKIVDDFQVNENVGTSLSRSIANLAGDGYGNVVFVWADKRNERYDIFFQRYDSLNNPIGSNTRVNREMPGASYAAIAMAKNGLFCVVWATQDDKGTCINYQRYDSEGHAITGNQSCIVTAGNGGIFYPRIAMDDTGGFVVAWYRKNVYFHRFDQNGTPLGETVCVNPGQTKDLYDIYFMFEYLDITMDSHGNFAIVWNDNRFREKCEIYCQLYSSSGVPHGNSILVNDNPDFNQVNPTITYDTNNDVIVAWMDERSGYFAVWAQRYDHDGIPKGKNFQVGSAGASRVQSYPAISRLPSGGFVIIWDEQDDRGPCIFGQFFTVESAPGLIFSVKDKKDTWVLRSGRNPLWVDEQGTMVIGWLELRDGCWGLYNRKFDANGNILLPEKRVNDDIGSNPQTDPAIAMNTNGDFTIVWIDYRNGFARIWCQCYNRLARGISNAFRLSMNAVNVDEYDPQVAMVNETSVVVLWYYHPREEMTNGGYNMQLCSVYGSAVTPVVHPTEETFYWFPEPWLVSGSGNGRYVLVWSESDAEDNIMCQYYDSVGQQSGEKQQVNDETAKISSVPPAVVMNGKGETAILWNDYRESVDNLYFQRVNSNGRAVGSNTPICDHFIGNQERTIASNDSGYLIVVWEEYSSRKSQDIFYQRFDPHGKVLERNVLVNDNPPGSDAIKPAAAMDDNGNFVITWQDGRNGPENSDIYCQRYRADGTPVGKNLKVNGDNTTRTQTNPAIVFRNDIIVTTWQTNHNEGQSWDIYANLIQFSDETAAEHDFGEIPASFELLQNHPNPFNARTIVDFALPTDGKVKLAVYNLLGQEVAVLLNGQMAAGRHRVLWDAVNVKSGVYICRLTTQRQNLCRKLTVIK
jgi:hypothetical protein